jgi:hypothetical protein
LFCQNIKSLCCPIIQGWVVIKYYYTSAIKNAIPFPGRNISQMSKPVLFLDVNISVYIRIEEANMGGVWDQFDRHYTVQ